MTLPVPIAPPLAGWWRRVGATLVDGLLGVALVAPLLPLATTVGHASTRTGLGVLDGARVALAAVVLLQLVLQGLTGGTVGKHLLGLRVVSRSTGRPTGGVLGVVRGVAHLLDVLPLYLGYLLPLVTRRRATVADLLCGTVVVRTARVRVGAAVPALAAAVTALLVAGGLVVDVRSDAPLLAVSQAVDAPVTTTPTATSPATTAPATTPTPAAAPPVGPLPPEDLLGRIAPPAPGFEVVPDAESGLGPLTVEQAAALGGDGKDTVAKAGLVQLGYRSGYARGFVGTSYTYAVTVFRLRDADAVQVVLRGTAKDTGTHPGQVPGSVVVPLDGEVPGLGCLFGRGEDLYEVDVFGSAGKADEAQLTNRARAQYEHVLLTG